MDMPLIGLCGRRGAGKDTAFEFIQEWVAERGLRAVRRGFADKLKHSAALALGLDVGMADALVLMGELKIVGEVNTIIPNQSLSISIDGRKFLQLYGTEAHRDVFGENFWVDALLPRDGYIQNFMDPYESSFPNVCVVTDVRFENEAERIKAFGGEIWEVHRGGQKIQDGHASEAGLPPDLIDCTIYNNAEGKPEQLRDNVRRTLANMEIFS